MIKSVVGKIYCVFDKVSGHLSEFGVYQNDGLAVRSILLTYRVPLKDSDVLCLGEYKVDVSKSDFSFNDVKLDFYKKPVLVPWSAYKFPEDLAEALAPLDLSPDEISEISRAKIKDEVNNG